MERDEAAKLVTMLVKAFPDTKADAGTVKVYVDMILDLDFEATKRGIARILASAKWFPKIAEIREAAQVACGRRLRSGAEAWLDVVEQIRKEGGRWGKPKFKDPIVAEIVRRCGWVTLSDSGDSVADRARFIAMYDAMAKQQWEEAVCGSIGGQLGQGEHVRRLVGGIGNGGAK